MKNLKLPVILVGSLLLASQSKAVDFDFSGTFIRDNQVDSLFFTIDAPKTVTVFSSSWDDGGFDPILAIWDSAGNLLYEQDDGGNVGSTLSNAVSYDHGVWDSYYTVSLASAGTYRATIAEYNNFAAGSLLSSGFIHDSDPHFTFTNGWGPQPDFNGVSGIPDDPRTGDYVFHILNADAAHQESGVPDSTSTVGLIALGLAMMIGAHRRFVRRS